MLKNLVDVGAAATEHASQRNNGQSLPLYFLAYEVTDVRLWCGGVLFHGIRRKRGFRSNPSCIRYRQTPPNERIRMIYPTPYMQLHTGAEPYVYVLHTVGRYPSAPSSLVEIGDFDTKERSTVTPSIGTKIVKTESLHKFEAAKLFRPHKKGKRERESLFALSLL